MARCSSQRERNCGSATGHGRGRGRFPASLPRRCRGIRRSRCSRSSAIVSPAALVNPAKFAVLNGVAYFATYGYRLFWRTDGTSAGTYQIQGIVPPGSDVLDIAATLGKLWIVSRKYGEAMKLLTSDGT